MTSFANSDSAVQAITGLILAGGRASRMQHQDKGLQQLNGKSLVQHVISRLQPQVESLSINANRHREVYAQFGFPVWPDLNFENGNESPEFNGPLAGVESGLSHCTTPFMLTVPCDAPFLPGDLAQQLMAALVHQKADIAVACTGDRENPRLQPVFCLIPVTLLVQLQTYLNTGGRKMDGWYGNSSVAKVYFANDSEFRNINTPEELQACATSLSRE